MKLLPHRRGGLPVCLRSLALVGWALAAVALAVPVRAASPSPEEAPDRAHEEPATVSVQLPGVAEEVAIEELPDGSLQFVLELRSGRDLALSPEEFARKVHREQAGRAWWKRFLNVSGPIGIVWVGLGFLGQLLFTARMLVQWITSERSGRSVVPIAFWWLSLVGATMLLVYFVWRRDVVGVVGQTTGWIVYLRNLVLLTREAGAGSESATDRVAAEPASGPEDSPLAGLSRPADSTAG